MKIKAMKLEVLIIDFDGLGENEVKHALQGGRFANRCISPDVKSVESVDLDWDDDHPLNMRDTCDDEYLKLFPAKSAESLKAESEDLKKQIEALNGELRDMEPI